MHPETFGRLMVFSPSLWAAPKIYFNAIQFFNPYETKIYLYAGGKESVDMYPNVQRFRSALALQGLDSSRLSFRISFDPMGQHREARWGEEFPKALEWLFGDNRLFLD
jgi:predicted alpha/beta superfamily hydrolase